MTPEELRASRKRLGLTLPQLRDELGRWGWTVSLSTVNGWTQRGAPAYVAVILRLMEVAPAPNGAAKQRRVR